MMTRMKTSLLQKIPAVMTIAKAVLSILQVVAGTWVQLQYPKGGQDGGF
jgi:hypothetical protein